MKHSDCLALPVASGLATKGTSIEVLIQAGICDAAVLTARNSDMIDSSYCLESFAGDNCAIQRNQVVIYD